MGMWLPSVCQCTWRSGRLPATPASLPRPQFPWSQHLHTLGAEEFLGREPHLHIFLGVGAHTSATTLKTVLPFSRPLRWAGGGGRVLLGRVFVARESSGT